MIDSVVTVSPPRCLHYLLQIHGRGEAAGSIPHVPEAADSV